MDSNVEMAWDTFTGSDYEDLYLGLLKARCIRDEIDIDQTTLNRQFILHLHRGIGYLVNIKSIQDLLSLVEHSKSK